MAISLLLWSTRKGIRTSAAKVGGFGCNGCELVRLGQHEQGIQSVVHLRQGHVPRLPCPIFSDRDWHS